MAPPLLIAQDTDMAGEALRLAAASGCELQHRAEPDELGRAWREAPVVLLDEGGALKCAAQGLRKRPGVIVLCRSPTEPLWRAAIQLGAEQLLELPAAERTLIGILSDAVDSTARQPGRALAVIGGCGGAGASVLAAATAVTAARRGNTALLVDCDPHGGGIDLTVGTELVPGLRWSGLTVHGGRLAAGAMHSALPARQIGSGTLAVLACDRDQRARPPSSEAVRAVLAAGRRAGDVVVCDLARTPTEPVIAALRQAELVVVVVPAEVRACASAAKTVAAVQRHTSGAVKLAVRGPAASGLRLADIRRAVGADVLTVLRPYPGLSTALDRSGLGLSRAGRRGPLVRAAQDVLAELSPNTTADLQNPAPDTESDHNGFFARCD
ncbi:septum site-determining protein Ssd [Saccharopolyspora rectivirgula]|jgi:secretion/DNA translocation related CpaE-like protein|uniref:septum site-determining protein Ssd n=1 Tax=Saccharopolyspora rectivirgula TaxID=28042 RepID=UPI000407A654|nr:septum site-determining protein Ssd [Saccharopolyspora rectivirgula]